MKINVNDHIGAYYIDVATGKWSIIGASDEMNEALNTKLKKIQFIMMNMSVRMPYS